MNKPNETPERVYTKQELEKHLKEQRELIAEKLHPKRSNMAQITEYIRILNIKLKVV